MSDALVAIATQFKSPSEILSITPLGNGNINDTYRVQLTTVTEPYFVLQRLNTQIFQEPQQVMQNIRTLTEHSRRHPPLDPERRWELPQVLLTDHQQDHWIDPAGAFWRGLSFIQHATTFETIQNPTHAWEIGYGLGMFHSLISDLPPERLVDTLPGFHITPHYLQQYDTVLEFQSAHPLPEIAYGLKFVSDRRVGAAVLETAKAQGKLPLRLMHGDPKINNILFDTTTGQAISLIDLDTVKPGLIHYDIGDCLRSGCNRLGEETQQWETVCFDTDLCQSILQGYCSTARSFLTTADYTYLYEAIRLIAFELGLRFFTDYLGGNRYFKTTYPDQNLVRALVQFKLTESIETQQAAIQTIIEDLR
jgi:Ser/Thr protein kinase RdoA (MazF antagonist)